MKVVFEKDSLTQAIAKALSAVATSGTIKAIEGIQMIAQANGDVTLNSFDLEKGIRCTIKATVKEEGSFIINAQRLSQILRVMPSPIEIDIDAAGHTKIHSGLSEYTLSALPGSDFPNTPMLEGDWGFTMQQGQLRDMIAKTIYAVANNDPRPALNGMLFRIENERIVLVSSDSFRLSICEKQLDLKKESFENKDLSLSMVVPGKTVSELYKLLADNEKPVRILATNKHIIFIFGNTFFFSRLINTSYIEYEKFIPKNPKTFVIADRMELLESLERVALVCEEKGQGKSKGAVACKFESDGRLMLSSTSQSSSVYDEVTIEIEGESLEIGMHCRYLIDALRAADTERIRISLVSPLVSIVMEPLYRQEDEKAWKKQGIAKESFLFLVVPVRL